MSLPRKSSWISSDKVPPSSITLRQNRELEFNQFQFERFPRNLILLSGELFSFKLLSVATQFVIPAVRKVSIRQKIVSVAVFSEKWSQVPSEKWFIVALQSRALSGNKNRFTLQAEDNEHGKTEGLAAEKVGIKWFAEREESSKNTRVEERCFPGVGSSKKLSRNISHQHSRQKEKKMFLLPHAVSKSIRNTSCNKNSLIPVKYFLIYTRGRASAAFIHLTHFEEIWVRIFVIDTLQLRSLEKSDKNRLFSTSSFLTWHALWLTPKKMRR